MLACLAIGGEQMAQDRALSWLRMQVLRRMLHLYDG